MLEKQAKGKKRSKVGGEKKANRVRLRDGPIPVGISDFRSITEQRGAGDLILYS